MGLYSLLSSIVVVREKNSQAFYRNLIAPIGDWVFILGLFVSLFIVIFGQSLMVMGLGRFLFSISVLNNLPNVILPIIILGSVFILIRLIIGYVFNSQETAVVGSISVSCSLFLFSSTVLPLQQMSVSLSRVAKYNPFVL